MTPLSPHELGLIDRCLKKLAGWLAWRPPALDVDGSPAADKPLTRTRLGDVIWLTYDADGKVREPVPLEFTISEPARPRFYDGPFSRYLRDKAVPPGGWPKEFPPHLAPDSCWRADWRGNGMHDALVLLSWALGHKPGDTVPARTDQCVEAALIELAANRLISQQEGP